GRYVMSPGSVIGGIEYVFERPLSCILPIPKIIIDEYIKVGVSTGDITGDIKIKVRAKCILQILSYDLPIGQRKLAYHIAYSKMRIEGHKKSFAVSLCKIANRRISEPLEEDEFDFGKVYHYGCVRVNAELDFVNCSNCQVRGGLKVGSLLMRSIHKINTLTTSERSVLAVLDSYFRGESPSAYEVSKYITNMNHKTILEAMKVLKEKEIIG
ncbi:unnamed protein product, partial [marine sediment metagenome]